MGVASGEKRTAGEGHHAVVFSETTMLVRYAMAT